MKSNTIIKNITKNSYRNISVLVIALATILTILFFQQFSFGAENNKNMINKKNNNFTQWVHVPNEGMSSKIKNITHRINLTMNSVSPLNGVRLTKLSTLSAYKNKIPSEESLISVKYTIDQGIVKNVKVLDYKKNGFFLKFYDSGNPQNYWEIKNGLPEGPVVQLWKNGNLSSLLFQKFTVRNGKKHGELVRYVYGWGKSGNLIYHKDATSAMKKKPEY